MERLTSVSAPVESKGLSSAVANPIKADWRPFVIVYPNQRYRFFPSFESDCDSEDLTSTTKSRAVIEQKFAVYLTILAQRRYEQHFKVANFVVLFVAPLRRASWR